MDASYGSTFLAWEDLRAVLRDDLRILVCRTDARLERSSRLASPAGTAATIRSRKELIS